MTCEVWDVMNRNEQYARGWLRLFGQLNSTTAAYMGKYAVDLTKLKRKHEQECPWCKKNVNPEDRLTEDARNTCASTESSPLIREP